MVKLKGPGLAAEASGSLGGVLTFAKWRGRAYAKKLTIPKQPRPREQLAARSTHKYLTTDWGRRSASNRASWSALVPEPYADAYRAYLGHNISRWMRHAPCGLVYPVTEAGSPDAVSVFTAAGQGRRALLHFELGTVNQNQCIVIMRNPGGLFVATALHTVQIIWAAHVKSYDVHDSPPTPGAWAYYCMTWNWWGAMTPGSFQYVNTS